MKKEKFGWKGISGLKGKSLDEKGEVFKQRKTYESAMEEKNEFFKQREKYESAMEEKSEV